MSGCKNNGTVSFIKMCLICHNKNIKTKQSKSKQLTAKHSCVQASKGLTLQITVSFLCQSFIKSHCQDVPPFSSLCLVSLYLWGHPFLLFRYIHRLLVVCMSCYSIVSYKLHFIWYIKRYLGCLLYFDFNVHAIPYTVVEKLWCGCPQISVSLSSLHWFVSGQGKCLSKFTR